MPWPKGTRALVLHNAKARQGEQALVPVRERLAAGGLLVTVEPFESLPEIARDVTRLHQTADIIVVCGGDGSISSAAPAVIESGQGHSRRIDVGTVNGHAFFNVASIGISSELAQKLDPAIKKRFGRLGYAVAALRVILAAQRFRARIREKGESRTVSTYQVAIGNGRLYGGGNVVEENAAIDDGTLDLYSLEVKNLWKLALMLRAFRSGTHGAWKEVRTAKCVEFDIETRRPMPVNTDGEIVTATPAHFRVLPRAISVLAPCECPVTSRQFPLYHH